MITLPSCFIPAGRTAAVVSTPSVASMTSTVFGAFIFRVPRTGTIKTVTFGSGPTVSTPGNVEVSLQDVDLATGLPDSTKDQYRVVNVTGASSLFKTGTLTTTGADGGGQRSVTKGDWLAVVFTPESGIAAQLAGSRNAPANGSSYIASYSAGWSKGSTTVGVALALEYDDGYFESLELDPAQIASVSYNTGSTPDERALYFIPDVALRIGGARVMVDGDNDFDVILYDASNNVLASVSVDKDTRGDTAGEPYIVLFASDVTLTAGATYRLCVKPTTGSSIALIYYVFRASTEVAQVIGMSAQMSTRTDAGAWSQTSTQLPAIALLINGVESGGLLGPNMRGFFQ